LLPGPCPHSMPRRFCRCALALTAWAATGRAAAAHGNETVAEFGALGRRLFASSQCMDELDHMVNDENYQFVYRKASRWCRVRLENRMAHCCALMDFPKGTADGCDPSSCSADCRHTKMQEVCPIFGRYCNVRRNPFVQTGPYDGTRDSDAPMVEVLETFCVPDACDNGPDRDALMQWYSVRYRAERSGWQANYDQATLECDSGVLTIMLVTGACIVFVVCIAPACFFLCVAPRERGRTLVSQAEMNADNGDTVEPLDDFSKTRDLRGNAIGDLSGTGQQSLY